MHMKIEKKYSKAHQDQIVYNQWYQKTLKLIRKERHITKKDKSKNNSIFLIKSNVSNNTVYNIFNVLKEKINQSRILYLVNTSLKSKGEAKTFSDIKYWRIFITNRTAL